MSDLADRPGDYLDAIPSYQRELVDRMLLTADAAEIARQWMDNTGHTNTAPFGAVRDTGARFYLNTLKELQKLCCGGAEYEDARSSILKDLGATKAVTVAAVTSWIAPSVGVSAVVLAPAVVLTFVVLSRAAERTGCEQLSDMIEALEAT